MTKTATISFSTENVEVAAGVVVASGIAAQLFLAGSPSGPRVQVAEGASSVDFVIDIPGKYHVELSKLDASGAVIGVPAPSLPFDIAETVAVPTAVKVALA